MTCLGGSEDRSLIFWALGREANFGGLRLFLFFCFFVLLPCLDLLSTPYWTGGGQGRGMYVVDRL